MNCVEQAVQLCLQLNGYRPKWVVCIERGGRPLGAALADRFGVPLLPLNIGYPLSRLPHPIFEWLTFPIKELVYRLSTPQLSHSADLSDISPDAPLLLVDDSASSGKTVRLALSLLHREGHRGPIKIAVERVGRRAAHLVDAAIRRS